MLGVQVSVNQNGKFLSLNESIAIFVSVRKDNTESLLHFTATVFTMIPNDRESLMQQVQVLRCQVH
jgi:hypothetical protein